MKAHRDILKIVKQTKTPVIPLPYMIISMLTYVLHVTTHIRQCECVSLNVVALVSYLCYF